MLFSFLFCFTIHPVCPVCPSTCYLHHIGRPPQACPPPIDGGRWGQAAWALGSVRMGPWHGLPLDPRRPVQRHVVGGHITLVLLATSNCTPKPAVLLCWTTTTRGDTLKSSEAQFRVSLVANQRIRSLSRCCSTVPSARGVSASDAPSLVCLRLFACSKALLHRYARRRRWVVCLIPHRNPRLASLWMPPPTTRQAGQGAARQAGNAATSVLCNVNLGVCLPPVPTAAPCVSRGLDQLARPAWMVQLAGCCSRAE